MSWEHLQDDPQQSFESATAQPVAGGIPQDSNNPAALYAANRQLTDQRDLWKARAFEWQEQTKLWQRRALMVVIAIPWASIGLVLAGYFLGVGGE